MNKTMKEGIWASIFFLAAASACSSSKSAVREGEGEGKTATETAAPATAPATGQTRYVFLTSGKPTGEQIESRAPDGALVVKFSFNDRGRGPDLTSKYWFNEDHTPKRVEIRGVDYYKVAVKEDFVREGDLARWDNASEHGSQEVKGPVFYSSLNGPPEEAAALVRAAWKTPDHKIAALPSGELEVNTLGTMELTRGAEKKTVTLYAISGTDFDPGFLWLDEEQHFFCGTGGWTSVILEGWEKDADALRDRQTELGRMRLENLAKTLSKKPTTPVAIHHVAVFDAEGKKLLRDQTVIVNGDKITAVGPTAKTKAPKNAELIDGKGKTLVPGLWDMHTHLGDTDGLQHLAAGVTTVRDLGNDVTQLLQIRKTWDEGTVLGPRVIFAGFIDGPGPYGMPIGKVVTTEAEIRKAIDDFADQGAEQIKLYSSLDPKLIPAAKDEVQKRGLRLSGHVPNGIHAQDFVEQGADELQHINFIALNFINVPDTRTPERFHAVGRETADLDLDSPKVKAFFELLRTKKTVIDPTLVTFEGMFRLRPGEVDPAIAPVDEHLPIGVRRGFRRGGVAPAGMEQRYKDAYAKMLKIVGLLHKSGVTIVAGTDYIAGFSLHREFELYVEAGISPSDVLALDTFGAATVMKKNDKLGSIKVGKLADMFLVDGDPTKNISDIRKGVLVMKGGVLYDPRALYAAIGVH